MTSSRPARTIPLDSEAYADLCYENNTAKSGGALGGGAKKHHHYRPGGSSPTTSEISTRSSRMAMGGTTKVKLLSEIREEEERREREEILRLADEADEAAARRQKDLLLGINSKMMMTPSEAANHDIESYLHSFDHMLTNRSANSSSFRSRGGDSAFTNGTIIGGGQSSTGVIPDNNTYTSSSPRGPQSTTGGGEALMYEVASLPSNATITRQQHTVQGGAGEPKKVARRIAIEFNEVEGLRPVPGSAVPYGQWAKPVVEKNDTPITLTSPMCEAEEVKNIVGGGTEGRMESLFVKASGVDDSDEDSDNGPIRPSFISDESGAAAALMRMSYCSQSAVGNNRLHGESLSQSVGNSTFPHHHYQGDTINGETNPTSKDGVVDPSANLDWMSHSAIALLSRSANYSTSSATAAGGVSSSALPVRPNIALATAAKIRASKTSNKSSLLDWSKQDEGIEKGILAEQRLDNLKNPALSDQVSNQEYDFFSGRPMLAARSTKATLLLGATNTAVQQQQQQAAAGQLVGGSPSFAVVCDTVGVDSAVSKELFIHESKFRKAHQRAQLLTEQLEGTRNELRARRLKALKIRMNEEEAVKNGAGSRRQSSSAQQRRSSFLYLGNNVFSDSAEEEEDDDNYIDDVPDVAALEAKNREFYWNETLQMRGRTATGNPIASDHGGDEDTHTKTNIHTSLAILRQAMQEMEEEAEAKGRMGVLYPHYEANSKLYKGSPRTASINPFLQLSYQNTKKKIVSGMLSSPKHSKKSSTSVATSPTSKDAGGPKKLPPVASVSTPAPRGRLGGYDTVAKPTPGVYQGTPSNASPSFLTTSVVSRASFHSGGGGVGEQQSPQSLCTAAISQVHNYSTLTTLSEGDETIVEELAKRVVLIKEANMKVAIEEARKHKERVILIRKRGGQVTADNLDDVLQGKVGEMRRGSGEEGDDLDSPPDCDSTAAIPTADPILKDALKCAPTPRAPLGARKKLGGDVTFLETTTTGLTDEMVESRALEQEYARLEPFLKAEEATETQRFLAEKWLTLVVLMKSLSHFAEKMEYMKAYESIETVGLPLLKRRLQTWRRAREIRAQVAARQEEVMMIRPDAREIKRMNPSLFIDWPVEVIGEFLEKASYVPYDENSVVFHEGDPSKQLYIIVSGIVEISVRHGKTTNPKLVKSRFHESNHMVVATLRRGAVFGEMASLTGEPRCASARCIESCDLLRVSHTDFFRVSTPLSNAVWNQVVNVCYDTRRKNISKVFALTEFDLSKQEVFSDWSTAALCDITPRFMPVFFSQGNDIFSTRKNENSCIYIVRGEVQVTPPVRGKSFFGPGELLGEDETIMSRTRDFTAVASKPTEAFILSRDNYIDAATDNAAFNNASRGILAERQANRIIKNDTPPTSLLEDTLMSFLFDENFIAKLWSMFAKPRVVWQSSLLFAAGSPCDTVFVVVKGTFHERLGGDAIGYNVQSRQRNRLIRSVTKQHQKKLRGRNAKQEQEKKLLHHSGGEGEGLEENNSQSNYDEETSSSSSDDEGRAGSVTGGNNPINNNANPFFALGKVDIINRNSDGSSDSSSSSDEEEVEEVRSLGVGIMCAATYRRKKVEIDEGDHHHSLSGGGESQRRLNKISRKRSSKAVLKSTMQPREEILGKTGGVLGAKGRSQSSSAISAMPAKKSVEAYFTESDYPSHQLFVVGSSDPEDQLITSTSYGPSRGASRASSPLLIAKNNINPSGSSRRIARRLSAATGANNNNNTAGSALGSASCSVTDAPLPRVSVTPHHGGWGGFNATPDDIPSTVRPRFQMVSTSTPGSTTFAVPPPLGNESFATHDTSCASSPTMSPRGKNRRFGSTVELVGLTANHLVATSHKEGVDEPSSTPYPLSPYSPLPSVLSIPSNEVNNHYDHISQSSRVASATHSHRNGTGLSQSAASPSTGSADAVVLGSLELALQHPTYLRTVWCTSECIIYEMPIKAISRQLSIDYPEVYQAMLNPTTKAKVLECLGNLQRLKYERGPRESAL